MELYQIELKDALDRLRNAGRELSDFPFQMSCLPPEPDDGAMFTAKYEVKVTRTMSAAMRTVVGSIGLSWVDQFEVALDSGKFD